MPNGDTYDLSPSKRTYKSLSSDVDPNSAVKELIDNIFDNWEAADQGGYPDLDIDIDFDFENDTFRIEDNSGGIDDENMAEVFALGRSSVSGVSNSIGSYGMGAKKALVRLGDQATIKSRTHEADAGYGFTVGETWFDSDSWDIDRQEFPNVDPGTTIIVINGLNIQVGNGESSEYESDYTYQYESPEDFLEELRSDLANTYQEYLIGRAGRDDGDAAIVANGVEISGPDEPDWAYTPFDGFRPRYFQNYRIESEDVPNRDSPVAVDIFAGLLREGKGEKAGTDLIIQNRKILSNVTNEEGGWGHYLPSYNAQRRRSRFIVKIEAEEGPEDLPWDTQKSHIDTNNPVTEEVFNFLRRTGEEYANAGYEDFPTPFTSPYSPENESSWGSSPESLDYSNRTIVTDKPNSDKEQANSIRTLAENHTEWGVFAAHLVAEPFGPGYRAAMDPDTRDGNYSPTDDEYWSVPEEGTSLPEPKLHELLRIVRRYAEGHVESREGFDFEDNAVWWSEYYVRQIEKEGLDVQSLTQEIEPPDLATRIEEREETGDLPDPILSDAMSAIEVETVASEVDGEDTVEEEEEESDDDDDSDDGASNGLSFEDLGGTDNLEYLSEEEEMSYIIMELSNESFNHLCEDLGLDSDNASPAQVGQEVVTEEINVLEYVGTG